MTPLRHLTQVGPAPLGWLLATALGCLAFSAVSTGSLRYGLFVAGLALLLLTPLQRMIQVVQGRARARLSRHLARLVGAEASPCFATDALGQIEYRNAAAKARFEGQSPDSLIAVLREQIAAPSALLFLLQSRADAFGHAREDRVTRRGHLRLSVHRIAEGQYILRFDEFLAGDAADEQVRAATENLAPPAIATDFEQVPVPLMTFAANGKLRRVNASARAMMGETDLEGTSFHALFEDLGRPVNDWLADVIEGRLPAGAEMLRLRSAGEESFVQLQLSRVMEDGAPVALAILSDVTALKRLEAQFDQSQKMQAIGQLAGGIAHDFNNLLTAISGHCDLLLLRRGREDLDFADLEQIRQNANRAAALVGQLLAFSRKQTLKPEHLDLAEVIGETTHLLKRLVGEKLLLRVAHDPNLAMVRADRRRLEQVLMNLVVNARDSMDGSGTILIETQGVTLLAPLLRDGATVSSGDYAVIRVVDSGCGIAPEYIDKIFDPFYTTKRLGEGTGLGLSTVYGIVKQSGGYIFVKSVVQQGTTFEVYLPAHQGAIRPIALAAPRPQLRDGSGVVLLVEDEAPVRAFAGRALRLHGYEVLEASNAEEALALLDDPGLSVDVFVSDMVMPGLDGPTWVKRALEHRPAARVVFISGYAEDHLSADQAQIANSLFLAKPFSLDDLAATVHRQMH